MSNDYISKTSISYGYTRIDYISRIEYQQQDDPHTPALHAQVGGSGTVHLLPIYI